jgi:FixJ family two-component response regulator
LGGLTRVQGRPNTVAVAVVEDDASMLRSIQRLLAAHGFAAEGFSSAEAFLCRDPDRPVACVVIDIHLPGISGLELRSRISTAGSTLPVIFITGIDNDVVKTAAIQMGCVAYLRKPFPTELLINALANAVRGLPAN